MSFKKGASGNPNGRPKGKTLADRLRRAVDQDFDRIMDGLLAQAKAGDTQAISLLLSRTIPPIKATQEPVKISLDGDTLTQQAMAVLAAMGNGALPPEQGKQLLDGLAAVAKIVETNELIKRVEALEAKK